MEQTLFAGSANVRLARHRCPTRHFSVAQNVDHFPDGEVTSRSVKLARHGIYLLQPTSPPVRGTCSNLLLADAPPPGRHTNDRDPHLGYARGIGVHQEGSDQGRGSLPSCSVLEVAAEDSGRGRPLTCHRRLFRRSAGALERRAPPG